MRVFVFNQSINADYLLSILTYYNCIVGGSMAKIPNVSDEVKKKIRVALDQMYMGSFEILPIQTSLSFTGDNPIAGTITYYWAGAKPGQVNTAVAIFEYKYNPQNREYDLRVTRDWND